MVWRNTPWSKKQSQLEIHNVKWVLAWLTYRSQCVNVGLISGFNFQYRSSYFQHIEEDARCFATQIMEMKHAIECFETRNMDELLKFHHYVELHLEDLSDETLVLQIECIDRIGLNNKITFQTLNDNLCFRDFLNLSSSRRLLTIFSVA